MKKEGQILIALDREFGSGGRDIAHLLGHFFEIPVYHHSLMASIGIHPNYDLDELRNSYDEAPRNYGMSRTVRGMNNSNSDHIAKEEFKLLKKRAEAGESFIVIGHCGEDILKDYGVISIFVSADKEMRVDRTIDTFGGTKKEAKKRMKDMDRNRKSYHNHYCKDHKWGDARCYDLCINSTRLGIDGTARLIESYIRKRTEGKD